MVTNVELDKFRIEGARQFLRVLYDTCPIECLKKKELLNLLDMLRNCETRDLDRFINEQNQIWQTPEGKFIFKER